MSETETSAAVAAPEQANTTSAPAADAPAPSIRDTMAAVLARYPDRGLDGRFESRATETPAEAPAEISTDQPETAAAEPATPAIEPPPSWSADHRQHWDTLPRAVQEYIAQREADAHKAISEKGARAAMADAIEAAIGDNKTALIAEYGSLDRAINTLVNVAMQAGQRPADFVKWFAQQHRLDLAQLVGAAQSQPTDQNIQALQTKIAQIEAHTQAQIAAQYEAQIAAFQNAKDAAGKPAHPHFDVLREEMARLLEARLVTTLDEAYAKAARMNDAVWAKIEAEREAQRAEAARAEAAKKAAEARKAASVNVRAHGAVAGSPVPGRTMRETMEAIARARFAEA